MDGVDGRIPCLRRVRVAAPYQTRPSTLALGGMGDLRRARGVRIIWYAVGFSPSWSRWQ
jgi:hypothetical protein